MLCAPEAAPTPTLENEVALATQAVLASPFGSQLLQNLEAGLLVNTDHSGYGSAEIAFNDIKNNLPEQADIMMWRASDISPQARHMGRCLPFRQHGASAGELVKFSFHNHVLFRLADRAELLQASCRNSSGEIVFVHDILQGFDLDAEALLEKVPTVPLVEPLTRMLFAGELGSVLLLSRWPLFDSLWADWPPRPWAQRARGLHYTPADGVGPELSVERLAADLRRWSSTLVDEAQDEPSEDALILESHLRALDKTSPHMASTYACQSWGIETRTFLSGVRFGGSEKQRQPQEPIEENVVFTPALLTGIGQSPWSGQHSHPHLGQSFSADG